MLLKYTKGENNHLCTITTNPVRKFTEKLKVKLTETNDYLQKKMYHGSKKLDLLKFEVYCLKKHYCQL